MDLVLRADGTWMVVELGDGQVSGPQDPTSATRFYARLRELTPGSQAHGAS